MARISQDLLLSNYFSWIHEDLEGKQQHRQRTYHLGLKNNNKDRFLQNVSIFNTSLEHTDS